MLLHAAVHWPAAANLQLRPFALEHAVYLWNILPDPITRLLPLELISGLRTLNTHTFDIYMCGDVLLLY